MKENLSKPQVQKFYVVSILITVPETEDESESEVEEPQFEKPNIPGEQCSLLFSQLITFKSLFS